MKDLIGSLSMALGVYAILFVTLMLIALDPLGCEPTEMSRVRYALGGGVACWLVEPVEKCEHKEAWRCRAAAAKGE